MTLLESSPILYPKKFCKDFINCMSMRGDGEGHVMHILDLICGIWFYKYRHYQYIKLNCQTVVDVLG